MKIPIIAMILLSISFLSASSLTAWADSTDAFSSDLYGQLSEKGKNLIYSPYSISSALSMTSLGALGVTKDEMQRVLHSGDENYDQQFGVVIRSLESVGKFGNVSLNTANSIWVEKNYRLRQRFIDLNRKYYNTGLYSVEFSKNPDKVRKEINKWIEEQTKDKIRDMLAENDLSRITRLVLANAVYFYGHWLHEFDPNKTEDQMFYPIDGEAVETPFMFIKERFRIHKDRTMTALDMPYLGEDVSMIIILPNESDGLPKLEDRLEELRDWLPVKDVDPTRELEVYIPRFKFEASFDLRDALVKMGMVAAFSDQADFRDIEPEGELFISKVKHKAFIEVNEAGTEAAAATVVEMRMKGAMPQETPQFRADHPFLFVIRHNITGAILFVGKIENPRE